MRSIYDNIAVGSQVTAAMTSANGSAYQVTGTGAAFDTKGYNTAELNVFVGQGSTATSTGSGTATLLECATSGGTYTPALANDGNTIQVTIGNFAVAAQSGAARIEGLGLNRKRYLKSQIVLTVATGTQTASGYAEIVAGRAYNNPTQTSSSDT